MQELNKSKRSTSQNYADERRSFLIKDSHRRTDQEEDDNENGQWHSIDGSYLQAAILTNACLWSFAPQGLSKTGHLADGLLDLIVIHPTTRKEFLRYVKRNANSKNQVLSTAFIQR
jgi:hypothetical protein